MPIWLIFELRRPTWPPRPARPPARRAEQAERPVRGQAWRPIELAGWAARPRGPPCFEEVALRAGEGGARRARLALDSPTLYLITHPLLHVLNLGGSCRRLGQSEQSKDHADGGGAGHHSPRHRLGQPASPQHAVCAAAVGQASGWSGCAARTVRLLQWGPPRHAAARLPAPAANAANAASGGQPGLHGPAAGKRRRGRVRRCSISAIAGCITETAESGPAVLPGESAAALRARLQAEAPPRHPALRHGRD